MLLQHTEKTKLLLLFELVWILNQRQTSCIFLLYNFSMVIRLALRLVFTWLTFSGWKLGYLAQIVGEAVLWTVVVFNQYISPMHCLTNFLFCCWIFLHVWSGIWLEVGMICCCSKLNQDFLPLGSGTGHVIAKWSFKKSDSKLMLLSLLFNCNG